MRSFCKMYIVWQSLSLQIRISKELHSIHSKLQKIQKIALRPHDPFMKSWGETAKDKKTLKAPSKRFASYFFCSALLPDSFSSHLKITFYTYLFCIWAKQIQSRAKYFDEMNATTFCHNAKNSLFELEASINYWQNSIKNGSMWVTDFRMVIPTIPMLGSRVMWATTVTKTKKRYHLYFD